MTKLWANLPAGWRRHCRGCGTGIVLLLCCGVTPLRGAESPAKTATNPLLRFGYTAGLFSPGYSMAPTMELIARHQQLCGQPNRFPADSGPAGSHQSLPPS